MSGAAIKAHALSNGYFHKRTHSVDDPAYTEECYFSHDSSRYTWDGVLCDEHWVQYDTDQDAWYFGVWVNPDTRMTVTYAEGDLYVCTYDDDDAFSAGLDSMQEFYGDPPPAFTCIDLDGSVTRVIDVESRNIGGVSRLSPELEAIVCRALTDKPALCHDCGARSTVGLYQCDDCLKRGREVCDA